MVNHSELRPAWAEVDLSAIAHNMRELRRVTADTARMMAVVKANAYGHGAIPIAETVLQNGADCLGVAILDEGRELREAGIQVPILILGYTPPEQAEKTVELHLTQTVYSMAGAEAISRAAVKLGQNARVHIKIDTGMGRLGYRTDFATPGEIAGIAQLPGLEIEGMFTHFAVADIRNKEYTYRQYESFMEIDSELRKMGIEIPIRHTANSAAIIDLPDVHVNMVRAGVSIYGLYPSGEVLKDRVELRPALSLKARLAQVKTVAANTGISYGRTFITDRETVVATVPLGYADGYTRLLSNKAKVIVDGRQVPVIGTICMDQFMIDVTGIPGVKAGDEVVLIGEQSGQRITADDVAELVGTINYEIVCMISSRIPRVYLNSSAGD